MTRSEHLAWSKERALALLGTDSSRSALISFISDLGKHEETKGHSAIPLAMALLEAGHLDHSIKMRDFIEGFS